MRTGAAYIRVSTDDQLEFSPDSQIKKIREYAKSNDIVVPDEYIFMEDDGKSGKFASKRPEFQRMIGTAKSNPKPFDVILVWKFSRFARNREDSVVYKSMLRKQCGIDVISISEPLSDDKTSILIEALLEAMDEYYSINLAEEVIRGMTEKASRGGIVGSAAYGYKAENGTFVPVEHEAAIVKMAFEKYAYEDIGCRTLAMILNDLGVRSKKGNLMENRTVEYMLRNPVYIGKIRWCTSGRCGRNIDNPNIILADGHHEPIVEKGLFDKVQEKLNLNRKVYSKHAREPSNSDYMLKGIVRCSNCGSTLVRSRDGLQCNAYSKGKCNVSHYITTTVINEVILNKICSDFENSTFTFSAVEKIETNTVDNAIELRLEHEYKKLERVKIAYENGIDTIEEYKENKFKIQKIIAEIKKQVKPKRQITKKEFVKKHQNTVGLLKSSDVPESKKNRLMRALIDNIVFDRTKGEFKIFYKL